MMGQAPESTLSWDCEAGPEPEGLVSPRGPIDETEREEHPGLACPSHVSDVLRSRPVGRTSGAGAPRRGTAVYGVLVGEVNGQSVTPSEGEIPKSSPGPPKGFNDRDSRARPAALAWESALPWRSGPSLRYDAADRHGLSPRGGRHPAPPEGSKESLGRAGELS